MIDVLALPDGDPLAEAALEFARSTEDRLVLDHSIRSFLFARLLAEHEGSDADAAYDERLLFAACVLHDLGLGTAGKGRARFEVEGADAAGAFLAGHGVVGREVDRVWEAIALHSSIGLADHMGLLTYLTHKGVFTDAGRFDELPPERAQLVWDAYPRPAGDTSIRQAIVRHAKRSEAAAPPFSIAADFLRAERAASA